MTRLVNMWYVHVYRMFGVPHVQCTTCSILININLTKHIVSSSHSFQYIMPGNKRKLRSRKNPLLFDDDDAAADIVTHEDVPMVDKLGRTKIKRIKVPLKATPDAASSSHSQAHDHFVPYLDEDPNLYENVDEFGPVPTAKNNKVSVFINYIIYVNVKTLVQNQTDYLKEFVDRIDELLRA